MGRDAARDGRQWRRFFAAKCAVSHAGERRVTTTPFRCSAATCMTRSAVRSLRYLRPQRWSHEVSVPATKCSRMACSPSNGTKTDSASRMSLKSVGSMRPRSTIGVCPAAIPRVLRMLGELRHRSRRVRPWSPAPAATKRSRPVQAPPARRWQCPVDER